MEGYKIANFYNTYSFVYKMLQIEITSKFWDIIVILWLVRPEHCSVHLFNQQLSSLSGLAFSFLLVQNFLREMISFVFLLSPASLEVAKLWNSLKITFSNLCNSFHFSLGWQWGARHTHTTCLTTKAIRCPKIFLLKDFSVQSKWLVILIEKCKQVMEWMPTRYLEFVAYAHVSL